MDIIVLSPVVYCRQQAHMTNVELKLWEPCFGVLYMALRVTGKESDVIFAVNTSKASIVVRIIIACDFGG